MNLLNDLTQKIFSYLFIVFSFILIYFIFINFNSIDEIKNKDINNTPIKNDIESTNKYINDLQENINKIKENISKQEDVEKSYANLKDTSKFDKLLNEISIYNLSSLNTEIEKNFYNSSQNTLLENNIEGLYFSNESDKKDNYAIGENNLIVDFIVNDYSRSNLNKKIFENNLKIATYNNIINNINTNKNYLIKSIFLNNLNKNINLENLKKGTISILDEKYSYYLNREQFMSQSEENKQYLINMLNIIKDESLKTTHNLSKNYSKYNLLNNILYSDLIGLNTLNSPMYRVSEHKINDKSYFKYLSNNIGELYKVEYKNDSKHIIFYIDKEFTPIGIVDLNKYDYTTEIKKEDLEIFNQSKIMFNNSN